MKYAKIINETTIDTNPPQSTVIDGVAHGNSASDPAALSWLPLDPAWWLDDSELMRRGIPYIHATSPITLGN